ncbi:hypothetical protein Tco_0490663 [Tanacetum coccineum]
MTTLKFADTHNIVVFLTKLAESEGFEQIVDFLNANPIRYVLTINPTIYTSCIEQFWDTVKVKTIHREVQLQALVDGKKIIITESTVRRDLQLEDAEGVDFLPNATIFEQLTLMGMVKNLDNAGKFLMYPRFVQIFLDKQLEGMSNHNRIYVTPSYTKKIFGNMRRVWEGFSGRKTSLFQTMVVQAQAEIGEGSTNLTDPYHTPTIIQPSTSQPQKKQRLKKPKRKDTQIPQSSGPTDNVAGEAVNEEMDDSLERDATTATSLDAEVLDLETTKTTQANEITSLKKRVKKLERRNKSRTYGLKRMYKVGLSRRVESSEDEGLGEDDASKQVRRINAIDADEDITLVNNQDDVDMFDVNDLDGDEVIVDNVDVVKTSEETKSVVEEVTDVEVTLAQALAELKSAKPKAVKVVIQEPEQGTTTTTPTTIISVPKPPQDKGKGIMIEEPVVEQVKPIKRLEQIRLDKELAFKLQAEKEKEERLAREKAQQTEEANIAWDDVQAKIKADYYSKRAGTELEQESIKKQKVDEDKETAELQRLIEIVPDEEEVAIDAIPLATKPPSIVDYKIHKEGKKTYYQIIRADGSSKMYLVFSHMLKSFDKEDLETLWKLVKAKHGSTRPEEGYERVLWGDLKTMFDPHVEDQVWRNQQDYRVLDWKIYDSCGVHSLRMQHMHIHMLVEKRYPLTPATITDMLNKKLQCDHFSEMLMLLVYKLLLLVLKVNAASTKVTTAQRLRLLKEFLLSKKG